MLIWSAALEDNDDALQVRWVFARTQLDTLFLSSGSSNIAATFFSANAEYNITFDLHFAPMRKYQQLFSTNDKVPEINQWINYFKNDVFIG